MFERSLTATAALLVRLMLVLLLGAACVVAPGMALAQDADTPAVTAPDAEAPAQAPAEEPTATDPPEADTTESDTAEAAEEAEEVAAEAAAEGAVAGAAVDEGGFDFTVLLITLAVLILPILIGNWIARRVRMPEYGWKISTILLVLSIGALAVGTGRFRGGPDLAGGITLVYEVAEPEAVAPEDGEEGDAPQPAARVDIDRMIDAIKQRVDPAGTKEVTIRRYGDAIEIIIPYAGQDDLRFIKRRITDLGQLEFRITADPRWDEDKPVIEKALQLGPSQKIVEINDRKVAQWVLYDDRPGSGFEQGDGRLVYRTAGSRKEALVLLDLYDVTGKYLTLAAKGIDDLGKPAVDFTFNAGGARRFGRLTGENLPNQATGAFRQLAILLDQKILSAPRLNTRITNRGQISGGAMDEAEVDYLISVLNAGSLPAALNKTPISEETISPTLGATTIEKGRRAIAVSLGAVLVFILFYYRFAGVVACLALAATMLLVLGAMVIIQAAFTLPGLAGLVLTVGMAVDANVLIYERIREEMKKGAGLRMAIRNGFDRATTTIVDANLTTLITGIVLYAIGTDQIRGFAVTLVLGLVMSMFTSIFCSRVVFDIAERRRWIKSLSFARLIGETNIDFLGKRHAAAVLSLVGHRPGPVRRVPVGKSDLLEHRLHGRGERHDRSLRRRTRPCRSSEVNEDARGDTELGDKNLLVVARNEALSSKRNRNQHALHDQLPAWRNVEEVEAILAKTFAGKLHDVLEVDRRPAADVRTRKRAAQPAPSCRSTFNAQRIFRR